jgi:hypothetical protein
LRRASNKKDTGLENWQPAFDRPTYKIIGGIIILAIITAGKHYHHFLDLQILMQL